MCPICGSHGRRSLLTFPEENHHSTGMAMERGAEAAYAFRIFKFVFVDGFQSRALSIQRLRSSCMCLVYTWGCLQMVIPQFMPS